MRHYTPTPVDPSVIAQQLAVIGVSGAAAFVWWTQTVPAKRLEVSRSKKSGEIAELLDELDEADREAEGQPTAGDRRVELHRPTLFFRRAHDSTSAASLAVSSSGCPFL